MKTLKWNVACLICIAVLIFAATPVAANGSPIKVFLNYLPEVSNYGPTDATGVAMISIGEAWVDLTADGLPELSDALYEAWIVNAQTEEMISLGKFNADAQGHVAYYAELDELPIAEYRYFIITVEPVPDPSTLADSRWTIAGIFPNTELQIVSGTPTPTLAPGVTPSPAAPLTLPVTGRGASYIWILPATALLLGIGLIYALRRSPGSSE
jgi:hypothetical protein